MIYFVLGSLLFLVTDLSINKYYFNVDYVICYYLYFVSNKINERDRFYYNIKYYKVSIIHIIICFSYNLKIKQFC